MMTNYHLTGFKRDCLQAIATVEGEADGLALKALLDDRYSDLITHPQVYQNLLTVDEKELLHITNAEHLLDAHVNSGDVLVTHAVLLTESGRSVA